MEPIKSSSPVRPFLLGLAISVVVLASALGGALADRLFVIKPLDAITQRIVPQTEEGTPVYTNLLDKESTVIDAADRASRSVVTISIKTQQVIGGFSPLDLFGFGFRLPQQQQTEEVQQDIGTGFIVDREAGLIVTNRHVISNANAEYLVIDKDNKEYPIKKMYRDPVNDIAIVQIDGQLPPLELGDSDKLKVGQSVIAIGTALGEFRHTVTTGVISGLGRGIIAGSGYGLSSERLDNVIQTDAAINPGNSGGPLLNSLGQVIGVNVAVAGNAQSIGFAIPINIVKESLQNFNETGQFDRPMLGVRYQRVPQRTAIMNNMPAGAYIIEVISGTPAQQAGLQEEDVITAFDGKDLTKEENDLAQLINQKKIGDTVEMTYWREGEQKTVTVTLTAKTE